MRSFTAFSTFGLFFLHNLHFYPEIAAFIGNTPRSSPQTAEHIKCGPQRKHVLLGRCSPTSKKRWHSQVSSTSDSTSLKGSHSSDQVEGIDGRRADGSVYEMNMKLMAKGRQKNFQGLMKVLKEIEEHYEPNTYTVNTLLDALIRCGCKDDQVLGAHFARLTARPRAPPNTVTFNTLLKFHQRQAAAAPAWNHRARRRAMAQSLDLWRAMTGRGGALGYDVGAGAAGGAGGEGQEGGPPRASRAPDRITYNTLIATCGAAGDSTKAMEFLELLRTSGLGCNERTLSTMLSIYAKSNKHSVNDMFRLLEEMTTEDGVKANVAVFNVLADACIEAGQHQLAELVLTEKIPGSGQQPDLQSFNILLKAKRQQGDTVGAEKVYEEMKTLYGRLDAVSYNTLIDIYAGAGQLDKAFEAVDEMKEQGHRVTAKSLNPIAVLFQKKYVSRSTGDLLDLKGVAARGGPGRGDLGAGARAALALFASHAGARPDTYTLVALMSPLARKGQPFRTLAVFHHYVEKEGVRPNMYIYNTVISALADAIAAVQVKTTAPNELHLWLPFYEMPPIDPDAPGKLEKQVRALLGACAAARAAARAGGHRPDATTHCALLDAAAEAADVRLALEFQELMKEDGVQHTVSSMNALIRCCARGKDLDAMRAAYAEMQRRGLEPNGRTYGALAAGFARCNEVGQAFELIEGLRRRHPELRPHPTLFTTVLHQCAKAGDLAGAEHAFGLYWELYADDPAELASQEVNVWAKMLQAYRWHRRSAEADALLRGRLRGGLPAACLPEAYEECLRVHCAAGDRARALALVGDMLASSAPPLPLTPPCLQAVLASFPDPSTAGALVRLLKQHGAPLSPEAHALLSARLMGALGEALGGAGRANLGRAARGISSAAGGRLGGLLRSGGGATAAAGGVGGGPAAVRDEGGSFRPGTAQRQRRQGSGARGEEGNNDGSKPLP